MFNVRYAWLFVFFVLLLVVQYHRLVMFGGISPNFLLVAALLAVVSNMPRTVFSFFLAGALVFSFVYSGFWLLPIIVLLLLLLVVRFFFRSFTGTLFLDFCILVMVLTISFSAIMSLFFGTQFIIVSILYEALYNLAIGSIGWLLVRPKRFIVSPL